ncbi:MAG: electron transport complex subunit RsxC [Gammaproteobacteria bacterium]
MDTLSLHDFPGGLALTANKETQTSVPVSRLATPVRVWVPMLQHRGSPAKVCVSVGDHVDVGTRLGKADGAFSADVHSSVAGVVSNIAPRVIAHRSGLSAVCVEVTSSPDQTVNTDLKLAHDYHLEDPNILRQRVADAGIVGLGGASFPTALKLTAEADKTLHTLVINGAECAPYISCDEMLMREQAENVVSGVQILLHVLQINNCFIALEEDKLAAINSMQDALEKLGDSRLKLCLVHAKYPEGGERQLIQVLSGLEVPSNGLPVDIGYLCHNVGTAHAVHQMVFEGHALTSRVVTVCGDGVAQPQNILAPVGTSIAELIEHCGGYTSDSQRLIIGGPMMGFTVGSDSVPVDKGSNCVLVMPEAEARDLTTQMPCIRCGACEEVCPASLLPQQLYYHARSEQLDGLPALKLFDCIECGCCDYVCPSNLPLTQYFRYAKDELWLHTQKQERAGVAKERYQQREERLERLQQERDAARAVRQMAAQSASQKKIDIQAALARAKSKKKTDGHSE